MSAEGNSIRTRPGKKSGEFVLELPPAWELRLRRVLHEQLRDQLPDPNEPGISQAERELRRLARRRQVQVLACQFLSELVMADIVGREVALATRSYYGRRKGSLREQVQEVLREFTPAPSPRQGAPSQWSPPPAAGAKRK